MSRSVSVQTAAATWEAENETLESVEARIHDGVPRAKLRERGQFLAKRIFELFPWFAINPQRRAVEIGPGVGYVVEGFAALTGSDQIIGLDVAAGMIRHARRRLSRDGLSPVKFVFEHYDGIRFPWPDGSIGAFYSVAAMQHIPKLYAYNLLFEMQRCLAPDGCAAIHTMLWRQLSAHRRSERESATSSPMSWGTGITAGTAPRSRHC